MNVQTPAARRNDPNASHEAAEHVTASGVRGAQQRMAAKAVELYPGLTSLELSNRTSLCRFVLARRLPECITAGAVKRGQERRCTVSGRTACTWHPPQAEEQLDLFSLEPTA